VLAALAAGAFKLRASRGAPPAQYRTETIESGTLTVSVTATGELKALTQVNIGTEISGVVESVAVDYNSPVRVGQILARVNTEKLEAQAAQARAGCSRRKPSACSRRPRWPRRRPSSPSCSTYAS
jgi:HlyD family secretion protein